MTDRDERYPPALIIPPARPVVYDVRDGFPELVPWLRKRKRIRTNWRGRPVLRDPSTLRVLMLHQMAVTFHREGRAFAERAAKTAYHCAVSDDGGEVALLKPWRVYANHGGYANAASIGLGVEGGYPGTVGRRNRKHTVVTPMLELGLRRAMEEVLADVDLETLVSHRQSSASRRGDPGQELWTMGADLARTLGLKVDGSTVWHDGRPVPGIWGGDTSVLY